MIWFRKIRHTDYFDKYIKILCYAIRFSYWRAGCESGLNNAIHYFFFDAHESN